MSVPIDCPKCGAPIGVKPGYPFGEIPNDLAGLSGECNHPKSKKTEKVQLLGLIKEILVEYPETETCDAWVEYIGPPNKFVLWLAIVFCGYHGVTVNKKWVWWNFEVGFFGQGIDELVNLKLNAT